MYWFQMRKQNAELRQTNAELGEQNSWLYDYALEGDELLAGARAQRNRLNEQCDQLKHDAAQQIADLHRLLLEATLARDDYRAKYEAAQEERTRTEAYTADVTGQREALREKLVAAQKQLLNGQPPPETPEAVKPKVPRRPRGKEQTA